MCLFKAVASQIELPDEFVYYFGLFLVQKEDGGDNSSKYKYKWLFSIYCKHIVFGGIWFLNILS